jgi:glutathione synthase/RimK-type ligase-like ATP-grasp enzyme
MDFPDFQFLFDETPRWHSAELKSVWFRRPGKPFEDIAPELRPPSPVLRYVEDQWHSLFEGLREVPDVLWINDPSKNHDAECKIRQLRVAQEVGFQIPRTCITTSKDTAVRFFEECRQQIIAKALYSPLIEYDDKDYFIFTSLVNTFANVSEEEFGISPTVFQELLAPKTDYRATIVGKHCFACAIESSDNISMPVDWRVKKTGVNFTPVEIPEEISEKCKGLVRGLGLVFGAIDLARVGDEFFFLEINPNGEWGWLQGKFPIAETLCEYLMAGLNHDP